MHWQYTPLLIPMLIALGTSTFLAFYAKRNHIARGANAFMWIMTAVSVWLISDILWMASHDIPIKLFFNAMQFFGIVTVPVAWLIFAFSYTSRQLWITRRRLLFLSIIPSITMVLVWTNGLHQWVWQRGEFFEDGGLLLMEWRAAPWFWVHSVYSYSLLLFGTILLVRTAFSSANIHRIQAIALVIGCLVPWGANAITIFRLSSQPNLDLTPVAFSLAGLTLAWPLFHFRLFDLVPVARNKLVDIMSDGMIVLDAQHRILDINPAAQQALGIQSKDIIGQIVHLAFAKWPDIVQQFLTTTQTHSEFSLHQNETVEYFDVRITSLLNQQNQVEGSLILFRNISDRKQQEEEREKLIGELHETLSQVKTLQNLLPICSSCKKIRDDKGYWEEVETYIYKHVDVMFSHSICPDCLKSLYPTIYGDITNENEED